MRRVSVPALFFRTPCFGCGTIIRFPLFVADFYNFATYRGRGTGDYYRVELGYATEIHTLVLVRAREGDAGIERLPDELSCFHCGANAGVPRENLKGLTGEFVPVEAPADIVVFD